MIGGGPGSFMGPVHRRAAAMDGLIQLVAGAFSTDEARNRAAAVDAGVSAERSSTDAIALLDREAALPPGQRAELVSIVAPNDVHAELSVAALQRGFALFCEKPLARDIGEARALADLAAAHRDRIAVAYTYQGYPMVQEARALIAAGVLGDLRRVTVSYTQGWLSERVERDGNAQAAWRTDPARSGASGCLGDIGVHAQSMVEFLSGETISEVMADLKSSFDSRRLDDDGSALFRLAGGASGTLIASQICAGDQNRLEVALFGSKGSLRWAQEQPSQLTLTDGAGRSTTLSASPAMLSDPAAREALRLPGGHPEGYIEALANLYRAFALHLRGSEGHALALPTIDAGLRSLAFVDAALESSRTRTWVTVKN
ncbi:Gfo/Idh/MocA family protein [Sphingomonas sp. Root720]|uniref:Gfo/Idh/MocA family protein n=2 Tax=Sphingomonas TaxID=13687 RepID=UPI0022860D4B|nr:Gfo/Idh/MocA family oxidoreductase [Sphingomonas sp. Root720]